MKRTEINRLFPDIDPGRMSLLPVLDQFHQGVMITDIHGVILYMNDTQARIDDLRIDDAIGRTVRDLYRVDEGTSPTMTCLKIGKAIENLACYYRTHLGKVVNSVHNIYPLRADGRLIGAICYITDYKNIEQTLAAISQAGLPRSVSTFGVSPVIGMRKPGENGTRFTFGDIIGAHTDLLAALKAAQLASDSPSPIMVFGETGTGKEMVAQSIHNHSSRKTQPYVAINCAAIPENLLEGMLFGTSKGAFTGAIDKAGLFETADGGTLFLDEINAMSPGLQAKLLRFLQERKVRRVGAMQEIDVELKVISSVNVLPHTAIESGSMRADLFYRLAVVFISIPPLRERMEDLGRLVSHFLAKANGHLGRQVTGIAMDVMGRFNRYTWPGNVRELEHVIEGAMNMVGAETTIQMHHLSVPFLMEHPRQATAPSHARSANRSGRFNPAFSASSKDPAFSGLTLAEMKTKSEIASIQAALAATRGNAAGAAHRLGISPQLMHYKLKRLGIDRRVFRETGRTKM
ncbi:sigma-54 interaction domain-containing protein [Desulfosarcina sp.]|uniref:sigma-54 interaction domain-containing protein n=1 Tax=Desulfosarcina sp. TaxID=2027861 RepID=UPI0029ABA04E|nr:sigma 54-interacting transcriptional regulator [Desulfosarcina sp.]MDX2452556.1 sigma 54-interacting transcriptional regulator [Desulfosarcina sp.]MDX2490326.1 sigma 54-interacting transcriptional regulator [Desulfosarcina sp.]